MPGAVMATELRTMLEAGQAKLAEARRPWWRRWVGTVAIFSFLPSNMATADDVSLGKYACIIEHAASIQEREGSSAIGRMEVDNPQFIMSIEAIDQTTRDYYCSGKGGSMYTKIKSQAVCSSSRHIEFNSKNITYTNYYGDGPYSYFSLDDAMLNLAGPNMQEEPKFLLYEMVPLDKGWGQYIYRGRCERF
jgi:hypothetical protein